MLTCLPGLFPDSFAPTSAGSVELPAPCPTKKRFGVYRGVMRVTPVRSRPPSPERFNPPPPVQAGSLNPG